ncbi:hypothetical protein IAQ61_003034, partial [Plenodomus lingam]
FAANPQLAGDANHSSHRRYSKQLINWGTTVRQLPSHVQGAVDEVHLVLRDEAVVLTRGLSVPVSRESQNMEVRILLSFVYHYKCTREVPQPWSE